MQRSASTRQPILWTAVLAVLMMSLAPAISQALRLDRVGGWAEVCSLGGAKWVKVDPASTEPAPDQAPTRGIEHCPYCSLHAATLGLPPSAFAPLPLLVHDPEVPRLFLAVPHTLFAWRAAPARGPPGFA